MESGNIPDLNIITSTNSFGNDREMFGAHRARLRSSSGFRADPSALEQTSSHFIEVELAEEMIVTGIATQGLEGEWVTEYTMMASQNGKDYLQFRELTNTMKKEVRQREHLYTAFDSEIGLK